MAVVKVLKLDEFRDRRRQRLRLAHALYGAEPSRGVLLGHLAEVADLTGTERAAVLWVDEYGPGLIHPHVVLDFLSDRPRRTFPVEPLHKAWDCGVPGAYDQASDAEAPTSATFSIALGSDGARAWFLVAESKSVRPAFTEPVRDRLMFLAGECSAIVLHRDLAVDDEDTRFAGWPILKDLEGRESDSVQGSAIARRFTVGRLARMLIDEDLSVSEEQLMDQARRARVEIAKGGIEASDEVMLEAVVRSYEVGDLSGLGEALLRLGDSAEAAGHPFGALELFRCAHDVAAGIGAPSIAIDGARSIGRLLRRRAEWKEAEAWYAIAFEIADQAGIQELAARSLAGLAIIKKDRGNLGAARAGLEKARSVAEASGDADTLASIHHDLLGLEHQAGDLRAALRHGWVAVSTYESEQGRARCMASLAGALKEFGDWQAAEDAYTVVVHTSDEHYYLIYAFDALAHLAALRGDEETFETRAAQCDALGWETGTHSAKAEILYYRALSYEALGRRSEAAAGLERAISFAEKHAFNLVLFRAEEALRSLSTKVREARQQVPTAPPEVREGLRALREDLASVEA